MSDLVFINLVDVSGEKLKVNVNYIIALEDNYLHIDGFDDNKPILLNDDSVEWLRKLLSLRTLGQRDLVEGW